MFASEAPAGPGGGRRRFSRLARLRSRIDHVESVFGDPWAAANPSGLAAIATAAAEDRLAPMAMQRYFCARLQDELVSQDLGGRFESLDQLGLVYRAVYRRDPGVGHALGFASLVANLLVEFNGTNTQRATLAETLLHRGLLGTAFPVYSDGTDAQATELTVRRVEDAYVLDGVKYDIANAYTAERIVVFARTGPQPTAYSTMLVDPAAAAPLAVRLHDRLPGLGVRGTEVAGLQFIGHRLPLDALIGPADHGLANGFRTLPVVHALLPCLLVGLADTGLRQAVHAYEAVRAPEPDNLAMRMALAGAFADLACADALSLVAARLVHLAPANSQVVSAASRYVVPSLLRDLLSDAIPAVGDGFHAGSGDDSVLAKHLRDLEVMAFSGVGLSNALNAIAPFLPELGQPEPSWLGACSPITFRLDVDVPVLAPTELARYGGHDGLVQYLGTVEPMLGLAVSMTGDGENLLALVTGLRDELRSLRTSCGRLREADPGPVHFRLANRYAHLLCAVAALGVWHNAGLGEQELGTQAAALRLGLERALGRLGHSLPPTSPQLVDTVYDELRRRCATSRSLDLFATTVAGPS